TTHAGVGAIIGQRADDTETRATVRAVGKRIVIMPVCRVVELAQALRAGGEVWQDKSRLCAILLAVANGDTAFAKCCNSLPIQVLYGCMWGKFTVQPQKKRVEAGCRGFGLDDNALWPVHDPAAKLKFSRQPVDKGAEPHTLYRPFDKNLPPFDHHELAAITSSSSRSWASSTS